MDIKMAKTKFITIGQLPDYIEEAVKRDFTPYSVALGRIRESDSDRFKPLGSGVFVKRGNRYGILTAHHCLHDSALFIGKNGTDRLALITHLTPGRILPASAVEEYELAPPADRAYNPFGPDLTFLEILPGERLGSIKGEVSFYPLDANVGTVKEKWSKPTTPIVLVGFPGRDYVTTNLTTEVIHHQVRHMAFMGVIDENAEVLKGDWDYLEIGVRYTETNDLPDCFAGVSGGPIWALQIKEDSFGKLHIQDYALVGIAFWQTMGVGDYRVIRGHFISSIYDVAWRNLPPKDGLFIN